MTWIARDKNNELYLFKDKPKREDDVWVPPYRNICIDSPYIIELPSDGDEKLINRHITWDDEPVEI